MTVVTDYFMEMELRERLRWKSASAVILLCVQSVTQSEYSKYDDPLSFIFLSWRHDEAQTNKCTKCATPRFRYSRCFFRMVLHSEFMKFWGDAARGGCANCMNFTWSRLPATLTNWMYCCVGCSISAFEQRATMNHCWFAKQLTKVCKQGVALSAY